jgi:hypothetical protein
MALAVPLWRPFEWASSCPVALPVRSMRAERRARPQPRTAFISTSHCKSDGHKEARRVGHSTGASCLLSVRRQLEEEEPAHFVAAGRCSCGGQCHCAQPARTHDNKSLWPRVRAASAEFDHGSMACTPPARLLVVGTRHVCVALTTPSLRHRSTGDTRQPEPASSAVHGRTCMPCHLPMLRGHSHDRRRLACIGQPSGRTDRE